LGLLIGGFLVLHRVANRVTAYPAQSGTDRSSSTRMTDRSANNGASSSAESCTTQSALFTRGKWLPCTSGGENCRGQPGKDRGSDTHAHPPRYIGYDKDAPQFRLFSRVGLFEMLKLPPFAALSVIAAAQLSCSQCIPVQLIFYRHTQGVGRHALLCSGTTSLLPSSGEPHQNQATAETSRQRQHDKLMSFSLAPGLAQLLGFVLLLELIDLVLLSLDLLLLR
jgi:hypothetical protein